MKGELIVFEGADCMFKETNSSLLCTYINSHYPEKQAKVVSFPRYGEPAAHFTETYLNKGYPRDIAPDAVSYFYLMDQFDYMSTEGDNLLENGHTLILDRYWYSDLVYRTASLLFSETPSQRRKGYKTLESIASNAEKLLKNYAANLVYIMTTGQAGIPYGDELLKKLWSDHKEDINVSRTRYMLDVAKAYDSDIIIPYITTREPAEICKIRIAYEAVDELGRIDNVILHDRDVIADKVYEKYEEFCRKVDIFNY